MLKQLLVFILVLVFCPVYSNAWTFLKRAEDRSARLILPKIIDKQGKLQACIQSEFGSYTPEEWVETRKNCRKEYYSSEEKYNACLEEYRKSFQKFLKDYYLAYTMLGSIYNEWLEGIRRFIRQSGREKEFADILRLLPTEISFAIVNEPKEGDDYITSCKTHRTNTQVDLFLNVSGDDFTYEGGAYLSENGQGKVLGRCNVTSQTRAIIYFTPSEKYSGAAADVLLHEVGHTLGLSEMYGSSASDSSIYTMGEFQVRGTGKGTTPSAMQGVYGYVIDNTGELRKERSSRVTCDDVDGIINLLDHYYGDKMSKRRTEGWLSLCPNKKIGYAFSLPFQVTDKEIADHENFIRKGYAGYNPFTDQIAKVAKKTAEFDKEFAAKLAEEKARKSQKEAERIKEELKVQRENEKENRRVEEYLNRDKAMKEEEATHLCAVCGEVVHHKDGKILNSSKSGRFVYIHNSCRGRFLGMSKVDKKYIHTKK